MSAVPPGEHDLAEVTLESESVFRGALLHVKRDRVRVPGGREAIREYVIHPGAVVIIAFTAAGEVVLERQHRYALGRDFIELPAGKIDPGEAPAQTAQRELAEETGYSAERWRYLGVMHPCIGYSNERIEIFLAEGLVAAQARPEHGELLEVFTAPLPRALAWVREGLITDAKSITALFWAEKLANGDWP
ncbi:MAG: NUDIX hydrolase [Burkholderiales bacterium]|nr:NUDIX hydrolase [Burkholderiales bacterium]